MSAETSLPTTEYVLGKFTLSGFTVMHRFARLQDAIHDWGDGGYTMRRIVRSQATELSATEFERANALLRDRRRLS